MAESLDQQTQLNSDTLVDQVVLRTKVVALRAQVAELADALRTHIRSAGDAHPLATETSPGFMSKELYSKLLSYQGLIDGLKAAIKEDEVPVGSMLWYYDNPANVPDDYVLCDGTNGTLNFADRFVLGTNVTKEIGNMGGENTIHGMPLPRHRHSIRNYVDVEVASELSAYTLPSNSNVKMITSGNKLGWECSKTYNSYPCCYDDYTQYAGSGSTSQSLNVKPPYIALHVIKRQDTELPVVEDGVGTLSIHVNSTLPVGVYACDGQQVSTLLYPDILRYAQNANLLRTQTEYTSALNAYGSAPFFVYDSENNLLRLPTIRNVLKIHNDGSIGALETKAAPHYHGMGNMINNNGVWGRYNYTTTYPSGTTGYFWNGSGGGGTESAPVTQGSVIVSYDINLGNTGNGLVTHSTNCVVGIRVYHSTTNSASVMSANTTVQSENIGNDVSTESIALAELGIEELRAKYRNLDLLGTPGYHIEPEGLTSTWSQVLCGDGDLSLTLPITFSDKPVHLDVQYKGEGLASIKVVSYTAASIHLKVLGEYSPTDTIYYKVYGQLEVGGNNE